MKASKAPRNELADNAVRFINLLTHGKGEHAGQPFNLRPWQEDIVRRLFGTLLPDKRRQYRTCYVEIPRKNGKGLSLDTPIPTPAGWTAMEHVRVGDTLFDETGATCSVTAVSDTHYLDCYAITFSNGEQIIADGEHRWLTRAQVDHPKRRGGMQVGAKYGQTVITRVRTTRELARTVRYGVRQDRNHSLVMPEPLELPETRLPVDPYVFGAWLGDGNSANTILNCGNVDVDHFEAECRQAGYLITRRRAKTAWRLMIQENAADLFGGSRPEGKGSSMNLQRRLRRLGVLGSGKKHIPAIYLRASFKQRLALLQGLMDTDGHAGMGTGRQCEYVTISTRLAENVAELLASLGIKYGWAVKTNLRCNRRSVPGEAHRLTFTLSAERFPVFRLPRKLERQARKRISDVKERSRTVQIVSVEPVETVPTRCLAVDSPSHLFRVGRTMLPTHNTQLAAAIGLYMLLGDGEAGAEVYSAAVDRDQASLVFNAAEQMVRNDPELAAMIEIIPSQRRMLYHGEGGVSMYRAIPADAPHAHGFNASAIIYDELHAAPNRDLWDVLRTSIGARRQPLIFVITTAGFDRESICYELHREAEQVRDGSISDPSFLPVLYGAPDDADWLDEGVWHAANPALGDFRSLEEMRIAAHQAKQFPARQNTFRRLYLCQWTESETRWLDPEAWKACGMQPIDLEALRGRACYLGIDLSTRTDMSACVAVFRDDDGGVTVLPHFWVPGEQLHARSTRDRVPYDAWAQAGMLEVTPGNAISHDAVYEYVMALPARLGIEIAELDFDPWNAQHLVQRFQDAGLPCVEIQQTYKGLTSATKELERLVKTRTLRHGNHPVLRWHAGNVVTVEDDAGNLRPSKRASTERIDGISALITTLARFIVQPDTTSIYESRGVLAF